VPPSGTPCGDKPQDGANDRNASGGRCTKGV